MSSLAMALPASISAYQKDRVPTVISPIPLDAHRFELICFQRHKKLRRHIFDKQPLSLYLSVSLLTCNQPIRSMPTFFLYTQEGRQQGIKEYVNSRPNYIPSSLGKGELLDVKVCSLGCVYHR